MKPYMYDYINVLTYFGVLFFTLIYNRYCTNIEVKTLILMQLILFFTATSIILMNSLRLNL